MTLLAKVRSFLYALLFRRRLEREMEDEWQFHLDARVDALMKRGSSRAEAERQARLEFGDPLRWTEQGREAHGLRWIQDLGSDVRYGVRHLRHAPAFASAAIATLALAIGANTAIFTIVNGLLLRPLPVAEPKRLVAVSAGSEMKYPWTYAIWEQIHQRAHLFDGALAWAPQRFTLADAGHMSPVDALLVSGDFFTTLGVRASVGRVLTSADDVRGAPAGAAAVISHGLWQRRFGGTAEIVGTPIVVEGVPFTVVGVAPPEFLGVEIGRAFDIAVPFGTEPLMRGSETLLDRRQASWVTVMLRLKPEQSVESATAMLRAEQPQIRDGAQPQAGPQALREFLTEPFTLLPASGGTSDLRQRFQRPLLAILAIVAVVLLIGCANIANLLLARAAARSHEVSLRFALGASRWRLVRQLLAESLLLAGAGAAVALPLAAWGSRALVAQLSTSTSRIVLDLSIDWRVLAFTTAVTMTTVLVFGTVPAFRATGVEPIDALKQPKSGWSLPRRNHPAAGSSALVMAQVTLSLVLIVCAGLLVGTFARLAGVPRGFDSDRVLVVTVDGSRARIDASNRIAFYQRVVEAVAAVPGVARAAGSSITPVSGVNYRFPVDGPEAASMPDTDRFVRANVITPGWFAAYGTTLKAGRDFNTHDSAGAQPVIVVNESFVRKFFQRGDAIGKTVTRMSPPGSDEVPVPRTIVGIVGDAIYRSARVGMEPLVYLPMAQENSIGRFFNISVRPSAGRPDALVRSVAAAITAVDSNLTFSIRSLEEQVNASFAQERLIALVSGFFGVVALLLAGVGLYGLTAYGVSRRRVEIGVRLALGARRSDVVALVLRRTLIATGVGVFCGLFAAAAAARYLEGMLFGLVPFDPTTFIGASATLMTVAAVAAALPARRATNLDPIVTLRCE